MQIRYVLLQWCVSNWLHWNNRRYVVQLRKACEDFLSGYSTVRYVCIWAFTVWRGESWASKYTKIPFSFNAYPLKANKDGNTCKILPILLLDAVILMVRVYTFIWNTSQSKVLQCYSLLFNSFFTWFLSPSMFEPTIIVLLIHTRDKLWEWSSFESKI